MSYNYHNNYNSYKKKPFHEPPKSKNYVVYVEKNNYDDYYEDEENPSEMPENNNFSMGYKNKNNNYYYKNNNNHNNYYYNENYEKKYCVYPKNHENKGRKNPNYSKKRLIEIYNQIEKGQINEEIQKNMKDIEKIFPELIKSKLIITPENYKFSNEINPNYCIIFEKEEDYYSYKEKKNKYEYKEKKSYYQNEKKDNKNFYHKEKLPEWAMDNNEKNTDVLNFEFKRLEGDIRGLNVKEKGKKSEEFFEKNEKNFNENTEKNENYKKIEEFLVKKKEIESKEEKQKPEEEDEDEFMYSNIDEEMEEKLKNNTNPEIDEYFFEKTDCKNIQNDVLSEDNFFDDDEENQPEWANINAKEIIDSTKNKDLSLFQNESEKKVKENFFFEQPKKNSSYNSLSHGLPNTKNYSKNNENSFSSNKKENLSETNSNKSANNKNLIFINFSNKYTHYNFQDNIWFYTDPHGKIQGPFSSVEMDLWNSDNYFPLSLPLGFLQSENFISLQEFKANPISIITASLNVNPNIYPKIKFQQYQNELLYKNQLPKPKSNIPKITDLTAPNYLPQFPLPFNKSNPSSSKKKLNPNAPTADFFQNDYFFKNDPSIQRAQLQQLNQVNYKNPSNNNLNHLNLLNPMSQTNQFNQFNKNFPVRQSTPPLTSQFNEFDNMGYFPGLPTIKNNNENNSFFMKNNNTTTFPQNNFNENYLGGGFGIMNKNEDFKGNPKNELNLGYCDFNQNFDNFDNNLN